jgi:hypothetical protein
MGEQGVLDHGGVDVVAAADDQVFGASREMDEAVVVDPRQIAGVQPAVDQLAKAVQHVTVCAAVDHVTGEDCRAADRQVADLAGGQVGPGTVIAHSDGFDPLIRQPLPDRAGPGVVGEAARAGASRLGETVTLDQCNPGVRLEIPAHRLRQG